jgi:hypothetical protein
MFLLLAGVLITPIANADISVRSINIPDVVASQSPNYGRCRFSIVLDKNSNTTETITIPISINGTIVSTVDVTMNPKDTSKIVAGNITFPSSSVLIINPFVKFAPVTVNYTVSLNPYMNPVTSKQYSVDVGSFNKSITALVYADWSMWAIIADVIIVMVSVFFIRKILK